MRKGHLFIIIIFIFSIVLTPVAIPRYDYIEQVSAQTVANESQIRLVQQRLRAWGYYNGPTSGVYGPLTKEAVIKFQRRHGLNAAGYLGPLTLEKIGINVGASTTPTTTTSGSTTYGPEIIKQVQQRLKSWNFYNGPISGVYGPLTTDAVIRFQRRHGLNAQGILGPLTLEKIGINVPTARTSYQSSNDLHLLARCVHAEARGEPYIGQVAVAAVILNRVRDSQFPNTISGVIYQPWAFTAVHDGQINLEPNQTAYKAAQDALNGWDPSYGSLFYYNPAVATSQWIFSRPIVTRIGRHVFCM